MHTRYVSALAGLLTALATSASIAQNAPLPGGSMGEFDCVIEPKLMLKLGTPETGIIQAVNVDRNQTVKKGDVVARLDSELQRIALDLAQAKASNENEINSERTRLSYRTTVADRSIELASRGNMPLKTRDEAVTEKDLADLALSRAQLEHDMAQLELANAQARLERRSIRSPVDGVVADVTIRPGEFAYEQAPLMTIAEIDPLYVKVFLPVRHYRKIQVGTVGEVRPEEPIGGVYKASVTVVDRVFDAASSTFGVRLELPNPDYALPAGMRCRVRFLGQ
jgi:RND family efflux transporter MFP subunit